MKSIALYCLCALFTLAANPVFAEETPNTKARTLDAADKEVKRTMVRDSMIGPRDTLVFYRFADQHAVLVLQIDNQSEKFPVKATVHLFAETVTAEKLDQWINNQHSDGLFPEVPKPTSIHQLPEGTCKVSSHEKSGRRDHGPAVYDDFKVQFKVDAFEQKGAFTLKAFTGDAGVLLKVNENPTVPKANGDANVWETFKIEYIDVKAKQVAKVRIDVNNKISSWPSIYNIGSAAITAGDGKKLAISDLKVGMTIQVHVTIKAGTTKPAPVNDPERKVRDLSDRKIYYGTNVVDIVKVIADK